MSSDNLWKKAEHILASDGVAILPTDTLYGIVASALSKKAVRGIYDIKGRNEGKPCIILITSLDDLKKFGISDRFIRLHAPTFKKFWPGKVSVVLPCTLKKLEYLHRGTETIAFRMVSPRNKSLFSLLKAVGPLVAPSANPQGYPPATTIAEAKAYFGDDIGLYISAGTRVSQPSTLVEFKNGRYTILRQGAVKIKP